jgi:hypothetical protein
MKGDRSLSLSLSLSQERAQQQTALLSHIGFRILCISLGGRRSVQIEKWRHPVVQGAVSGARFLLAQSIDESPSRFSSIKARLPVGGVF